MQPQPVRAGVDEVLSMAITGKSVRLTLEVDGQTHDLSGIVQDVSIMSGYDGMVSATFTVAGHETQVGGYVESSEAFLLHDNGHIPEVFIPDPPKPKKWTCAYCSTENPPGGDDGGCVRCGGPKGESVKPPLTTEE